MASTLLRELGSDFSLKTNATTKIKFIHPISTTDLISMLRQCDVVRTCEDEQASDLYSDEASLDQEPLTSPAPKTQDVATQVEESVVVDESSTKKDLREMKMTYDNIRLLKCECKKTEGKLLSADALDILTDGRILLLHHDTIKLYSFKLTLVSQFQLQHNAKDMCIVRENRDGDFTVAVCFDKLSKIKCLEHAGEFLENCDITCSHNVISISMYVHHLAVLVQCGGIQLLDISTGHVCYAYEEFRMTRDGSLATISNPTRICTCNTTKQIILADERTVYLLNIEDGKCEKHTLYSVAPCQWVYSKWSTALPDFTNTMDVKSDSHGYIYVLNVNGLYQLKMSYIPRKLILNYKWGSAFAIDEYRNRIVVGYSISGRAHVYKYTIPTKH